MKLFLWCKTQFCELPVSKVFDRYWKNYGGSKAVFSSPYVYISFLLTILLYPSWANGKNVFLAYAFDIIPSLIGFTVGGMAIMLALSSIPSFNLLAENGKNDSLFSKIIASFFHFILVQTLSLILFLFCKIYSNVLVNFSSVYLMMYGILLILAMAGQILQTAAIINATAFVKDKSENKEKSCTDTGSDFENPTS